MIMKTSIESAKPQIPICSVCNVFPTTIFRDGSAKELQKSFKCKKFIRFRKNEALFHENESAMGVYCIYTGMLKVVKKDHRQMEHIIRLGKPGDVLGIDSVVTHNKYSNTVIAVDAVEACFVPQECFVKFLKSNPGFFVDTMKLLCLQLDCMENKMTDFVGKTMKERLADLLLMLKADYGVKSDHTLNMTLSMDELASFLGTTKSSIYSMLNDLKRARVIEIQDNRIQVLSEKELENIARPIND